MTRRFKWRFHKLSMKLEVVLIALYCYLLYVNSVVSSSVTDLQMLVQKNYNSFWACEVSSSFISGYTISSVCKNCKWRKLGFFFFSPFTEKETRRPGQLLVSILVSWHILLYSLAWWQIHVCLKNSSTYK